MVKFQLDNKKVDGHNHKEIFDALNLPDEQLPKAII